MRYIWDEFDRQFQSHPHNARVLLKRLQESTTISTEDPERLWEFARSCRRAVILAKTNQGLDLTTLETPAAQNAVTGRLEKTLRDRWIDYVHGMVGRGTIQFETFAHWISEIADKCADPRFIIDDTDGPKKEQQQKKTKELTYCDDCRTEHQPG